MKKTVAIVLLGVVLVGSNLWWLYNAIDGGLSYTYLKVSYDDNRTALALLPVVARCGASRAEVITAATLPGEPSEPFEKDVMSLPDGSASSSTTTADW